MVERKFDWITTRRFDQELASLFVDDYELQVIFTSIDRFCACINKGDYKSVEYKGRFYFEIEVPLFTRTLIIFVEVEGIDAVLYKIERL